MKTRGRKARNCVTSMLIKFFRRIAERFTGGGAGDHFSVKLSGDRAREWRDILGAAELPIVSDVPEKILVMGRLDVPCYFLDLRRIHPDAQRKIAEHLARKFGQPLEDIETEIRTSGIPILAEGCRLIR